ncbi:Bug family tripartite tricarboxylate transporter substrate binding protein [Ottowia sp. VDI28]|uniref:Bug family tripartite tricarboxylate transporter substrate binding protein n=1 Tax=Ottowia sp. VDI28 TaxID=3133968 RepID=UPI003C2EC18D
MKRWILTALTTLTCLAAPQAWPQVPSYPTKPIRMVLPYAAGGGLDGITRLVAQAMSEKLGQSIVVENKGGAGGMIGAEAVAKATPDGYTLLMAGNPELVINPTLMPGARYDVTRDFIPIMLVAESPNVLVAQTGFNINLREIANGAQHADAPLTVGTPGQGSPQHLTVAVLKSKSKLDLIHIPYKGAGPAVIDVLGGQVRLALTGAPPLIPHIKSGKLKAIAVTQPKRSELLPDIPTLEEALGVTGMDNYSTWYGLLAPAQTPPVVVEALQKSVSAALARPDIKAKINEMGSEVVALPAAAFAERIKREHKRYEDIIRRFNIKAE